METLITILRAAHCKSTHHYFALDALLEVQSEEGHKLANLLLSYYQEYLTGAKDPDNVFKDFENHVLHVRDNFWGGAARTASRWYAKSLLLLEQQNWKEAAYSIGVLSHYFTDPFMPLHTGQTERESIVHRPMEWSVKCAYDEIYTLASEDPSLPSFALTDDTDWLSLAIQDAATIANQHYETLIEQYNMAESSKQPALALNRSSKRILAELFTLALTGWGAVLDRLAQQTPTGIADRSLTPATLIAGLQMPLQSLLKKIDSAKQKNEVAKIYEEFQTTGRVVRNLPVEQRTVAVVRSRDPQLSKLIAERSRNGVGTPPPLPIPKRSIVTPQPIPSIAKTPSTISHPSKPARIDLAPIVPSVPAEPLRDLSPSDPPSPLPAETHHSPTRMDAPDRREETTQVASKPRPDDVQKVRHEFVSEETSSSFQTESISQPTMESKSAYRLELDSPIVDAPSIGPKTAARFREIGCHSVREFLQSDVSELANQLQTKWITPEVLSDWQKQALLMCQVEKMTAVGATLLVIAGVDSAEQLATWESQSLKNRIDEAATTTVGKRVLRDQAPPTLERLSLWTDSARRSSR